MTRLSLVAAAFVMSIAQQAGAHAFLRRAVPAANSVVAPPPAELRLVFGSKLEGGFAKIEVSVDGRKVDGLQDAVVGQDGETVIQALPGRAAGNYLVHWSVVAHDGHRTGGSYSFHADTK